MIRLTATDFPCPRCKARKDEPCVSTGGRTPAGQTRSRPHDQRTARVPEQPPQCGTYGGYQRHTRNKETPCEPCKHANAAYMNQYRDARPADYAEAKVKNKARSRALWRLARDYPERFRQYVDEEVAAS